MSLTLTPISPSGGSLNFTNLTLTQNDANALKLTGAAAGITFGTDTTLVRSAASTLKANGELQSVGRLHAFAGGTAEVRIGDLGPASQAGIAFGSLADTNLYRVSSTILKTDGALHVGQDSSAQRGSAAQTIIGAVGPAAQAGVLFGSGLDTSIFRSNSNQAATPGDFWVAQGGAGGGAGSRLYFGAAATVWLTHTSTPALQLNDSFLWLDPSNTGRGLVFGASGDANLYRSAAQRVGTDYLFTAGLGVATKQKAGAPADGDWTSAPPNGTLVVDSTNNKIWARVGGVWKGVVIA